MAIGIERTLTNLCCIALLVSIMLDPVSPCTDTSGVIKDGKTCTQLATSSTKKECYDATIETLCCVTCVSFAITIPDCKYGDESPTPCFPWNCVGISNPRDCCETCYVAPPATTSTTQPTTTTIATTTTTPTTTTTTPTTTTTTPTTTTTTPTTTTTTPTTTTTTPTTTTTTPTTTTTTPTTTTTTTTPTTTTTTPTTTTTTPTTTTTTPTTTTTTPTTTTTTPTTTTTTPTTTTTTPTTTTTTPTTTTTTPTTTTTTPTTTTTTPTTTTTTPTTTTTTLTTTTTTTTPITTTTTPTTTTTTRTTTTTTPTTTTTTTPTTTTTTPTTTTSITTASTTTVGRTATSAANQISNTDMAYIVTGSTTGLILILLVLILAVHIITRHRRTNGTKRLDPPYPDHREQPHRDTRVIHPGKMDGHPSNHSGRRFHNSHHTHSKQPGVNDADPTIVPYNPYMYGSQSWIKEPEPSSNRYEMPPLSVVYDNRPFDNNFSYRPLARSHQNGQSRIQRATSYRPGHRTYFSGQLQATDSGWQNLAIYNSWKYRSPQI